MATLNLNPTSSKWGISTYSSWEIGDSLVWSGTPSQGGSYLTCLAFAIGDVVLNDSSKLVVKVVTNGTSSPAGCTGVLTLPLTPDLAPNQVQDTGATGLSDALAASAIATSRAYSDEVGTTLSGTGESSGTPFYFVFDGVDLEANTTYYVYLTRNTTGKSWVQATRGSVSATLTYEPYTACTAPTDFTAELTPLEDGVKLSWSGATAGVNNPIKNYVIKGSYSNDGSTWDTAWPNVWSGTDTSVTLSFDQLAEAGVTCDRGLYFRFRVRANGTAGADYASIWKFCDGLYRPHCANISSYDNASDTYIFPDSIAHIYDNGAFVKHIPYVYSNGEWRQKLN